MSNRTVQPRNQASSPHGIVRSTIANSVFDFRYAARTLRRQPGFALTVALTLALGLGLNATLLGMMDALLLRPFQFPGYERLVVLWETPIGSSERQSVAPANYLDWRQQATRVEELVAWEGWGATLAGRDEPERLQGFRVTPGFFEALGRSPVVGRSFLPAEERPGHDRRVVVGDGLWKRRFGADPRMVGTSILLDGESYTVVGIAPPGFDFPVGSEIWAPLAFTAERARDRGSRALTVLGKLAPHVSLATAQAEIDTISRQLAEQYPDTNRQRGVSVRTLSTAFREDGTGAFVGILIVGSLLVLLIACANLAGLLLARSNDRQRELAVRTALGASRMRVARQLIAETVLLGLVASGLALPLAQVGLDLLRSSIPADIAQHIEGWNNVRLDGRIVLIVPALAIGLGLLVGLIPALAASRADVTDVLKTADRGFTGGGKRQRTRQALVVAEISLALALLVTAGLALGGGIRMVNQPGGFDADRLLTFDVPLAASTYGDPDSRREVAGRLLARIQTLPAVEAAAFANVLPAAGWNPTVPFVSEADPDPDLARRPRAGFRAVSPGYFEAMRVPLLRGRPFSNFDREGTQPVAVVSASLAARFWPGEDPLGKRLRIDDSKLGWVTIVGVAGDVTMYNWWDGPEPSAVYMPFGQAPTTGHLSVAVRARVEPASMAPAIRAAVGSVDPLIAIHGVRTMQQAIVSSTFGLKFIAVLLAICGGIALALSIVGTYSMMSYAVSQRRHEFGVRMALGATSGDVLYSTLKQAGRLTGLGLAIGLGLAVALGSAMSAAMFGLIPLDPSVFAIVSAVLALVSLTAAYVPARRSVRVDPSTILREQ